MSQEIKTQSTSISDQRESFPRTTAFFDWGSYIIHRMEELVWQGKRLIFEIGFFLFLVYELAHFAKYLCENWSR